MITYFYHAHIRTLITAVGEVFSRLTIASVDSDGSVRTLRRVPIKYGPGDKWAALNEQQGEKSPTQTGSRSTYSYPRMYYEVEDITYDSERSRDPSRYLGKRIDGDADQMDFITTPAPYRVGFTLGIEGKNQTDCLQVVEQILPWFRPSLALRIKNPALGRGATMDTVLLLKSVSQHDSWDGDQSEKRVVTYELKLEAPVDLYPPTTKEVESGLQLSIGVENPATGNLVAVDTSAARFVAEVVVRRVAEDGEVLSSEVTGYEPEGARSLSEVARVTSGSADGLPEFFVVDSSPTLR